MADSSFSATPQFRTTRWSIVAKAAGSNAENKQAALSDLCDTYWLPVYVFVRRRGFDRHQAEDLTQDFFASFFENDKIVSSADQTKGRFRTYLLAALKNQIANHRRNSATKKRGGDVRTLSVDWQSAEQSYLAEPVDGWTAEAIYNRRWAMTVLQNVLKEVAAPYNDGSRAAWFDNLKPFLTTAEKPNYDELANQLQTTASAARVAVHRLRKQYRDALVNHIRDTVDDAEEVLGEKSVLLQALLGIPSAQKK